MSDIENISEGTINLSKEYFTELSIYGLKNKSDNLEILGRV